MLAFYKQSLLLFYNPWRYDF